MTGDRTVEERLQLLERAISGLGREVEAAKTAQAGLASQAALVELTGQVVKLGDQVAELPDLIAPPEPAELRPVQSWLTGLFEPFTPADVLRDLIGWMRTVHLRYADAAAELPECWLWHPEIIEELLWLMQAWRAAYLGKPSIRAVADWHDRLRPGVVRRITGYAGTCSLDNHHHDRAADQTVQVPTADAAGAIAAWWASDRDRPAPEPTDQQIAAADAAFNRRSRHRGAPS
ncbi:MAG: hypothetical protein J2P23_04075 [Microlunatus sp.]|nr:hypothetical protein [Microlunatus sp.]